MKTIYYIKTLTHNHGKNYVDTLRCKLKYYWSHRHVGIFVSPAPP
jgi:hypothetical protein